MKEIRDQFAKAVHITWEVVQSQLKVDWHIINVYAKTKQPLKKVEKNITSNTKEESLHAQKYR